MKLRALLLAALALPLASDALAAPPEKAAWSPQALPQRVAAVAVARDAVTIAAALDAPAQPGQCASNPLGGVPTTTPQVQQYDLAIFTIDAGLRATDACQGQGVVPGGRTHVEASADGRTVVSIGYRTEVGGQPNQLIVGYERTRGDDPFLDPDVNKTYRVDGVPLGLAVSDDGKRILAMTQSDAVNFTVYGLFVEGDGLFLSFRKDIAGNGTAIAGSADLSRFVVGARVPVGNETHGAVQVYSFSPPLVLAGRDVGLGVSVNDVAMTGDGARYAAALTDGRVLAFAYGAAGEPVSVSPAPGAAATRVAYSPDGSRLAAGAGGVLATYDAAMASVWSATLPGPAASLSLNQTGAVVLASVNASGGGVFAFGPTGAQFWSAPGAVPSAAINANATHLAYASGTQLVALRLPRGVSLEHPGGGDAGPARPVRPGEGTTFELTLRNNGSAPERVRLEGPRDLDVRVEFSPAVVDLAPDESVAILVNATPGQLVTGRRAFDVQAISLTSDRRDAATLEMELAAIVDVDLDVNVTEASAFPGQETAILLTVVNSGTRDVSVSLRAQQQPSGSGPWQVRIDPDALTLAPRSRTTVRVAVTPPESAQNGSANAVTYFLEGVDVADQARITYRVNPTVGLDFKAVSSVKFIGPGEAQTFNVVVRNTGSLPRAFRAYYDFNETSGLSWGIQMPTEEFTLDAGANRTLAVRVTAPAAAKPQDALRLDVTAELLPVGDEAPLSQKITLFANVIELPPTTVGEDGGGEIPGPGWALVALLAAVAALARRRRDP
ncbi:MAG TPA: hypothetical protein VHH36_07930 [Candidatus Thermoplasmatota archaeon]|nr:hypothetical protein [Candidatus Thermoplasmatota archaeon]